jgi:hypothetical protein
VLLGAATAVIVSFVALSIGWSRPRLRGASSGLPLARPLERLLDGSAARWTLRLLGLSVTGYTAIGVFGKDDALNPTAGMVYVVLWVGIPLTSVLVGPIWRYLNPLRTVHLLLSRMLRVDAEIGLRPYPSRLGLWPGAVGLAAFTWLELVAPDRATLPVLRGYLSFYIAFSFAGAALYGSRWFDRADPLEVYSTVAGSLSVIGHRQDGRLVLRNPLNGIDALPPTPGLLAVVCVLLGSTAFDALSSAPLWFSRVATSTVPSSLWATAGWSVMILTVSFTFAIATLLAGIIAGTSTRRLPSLFAHSMIPITIGYAVAHYYSLLVLEGQRTVILLSDPLGTGSDWLGLADRGVDGRLVGPNVVAIVQLVAVITGHLVGVLLAHDRAVRIFPRYQAVLGQLPLMAAAVGFTVGGLWLLFQ